MKERTRKNVFHISPSRAHVTSVVKLATRDFNAGAPPLREMTRRIENVSNVIYEDTSRETAQHDQGKMR